MRRAICWLLLLCLLPASACLAEAGVTLTVGDKSEEVLAVKERLQALYYIEQGKLTKTYTKKTADAVRAFQKANGLPETGDADPATRAALFADNAERKPFASLRPLKTPPPPPEPEWPARDADGFLAEGDEWFLEEDDLGRWIYLGRDLQVQILRRRDASIPMTWFETEIRTRNGETFRTALTDPEHPGKKFRYPYVISREEKFVLGFSDDFFATRMEANETVGIILRGGEIISGTTRLKRGHHLPNLDMMALYPDGRLAVYECNEHTAEELRAMGAVNVFSFGPILIRDGVIDALVYKYFKSLEPRHALGMIEPGHYLLISVQGRTKESKGTVLQRVAEMMKERGVTQALNLDGGNTMALVFRGRMLNKLAVYKNRRFVRTVTSLIGIGHTEDQAD